MINGVGTDIIEISRIRDMMSNPKFLQKGFTDSEILYIENSPCRCAGIFCAKEAVAKALGLGLSKIGIKNIEITHTELGQPVANVVGFNYTFQISISHCSDYATAVAFCQKKGV